MADAMLSVEVIADLEKLSAGLKKGTGYITGFASSTDALIKGIENSFKNLDIGNLRGLSSIIAAQKLENDRLITSVLKVKSANETAKTTIQNNTAALIQQRTATEAQRTAVATATAALSAFKLANAQNKTTVDAAAGSYDETRLKLTALGKEIRAAGGLFDNSNPAIVEQIAKYNSLNDKLKTVDSTMGNFQRNVGNYTKNSGLALTDLSRIAQDLPYGFIGIQNNLNPMLESFGRLKTETGSTGSALKAMAQGLIGPAGLGLALSAVSAGILMYQQYQQKARKATEDSKKITEDYVATLIQLQQAQLKGAQAAQTDLTHLKLLFNAYQNGNLPLQQRKEAYDELQRIYPAYFGNIKFEEKASDTTRQAYDKLSISILATAKARAAGDLITKNSTRQLENEQKIKNLQIDLDKKLLAQKLAIKKADEANTTVKGRSGEFTAIKGQQDITAAAKGIAEMQKLINDLKTDSNILTKKNGDLVKYVNDQMERGAVLSGNIGGETPDTKIDSKERVPKLKAEVKGLVSVLKALNIDLIQSENQFGKTFDQVQVAKVKDYQKAIDELIKLGYGPATEAVQDLKLAQHSLMQLEALPALKPIELKVSGGTGLGLVLNAEFAAIEKRAAEFNESFNSLLQNGFISTLGNVGLAIGEAFANGGNVLDAAGNELLKGFGEFLSGYGDLLIKYGAAAVLKGNLDVAALIPGAGIPAGIAAIAAGVALKIAGSAIGSFASGSKSNSSNGSSSPQYGVPHFANGGIVSGPTLAMVGEYPGAKSDPEVISPLSKLKTLIGDRSGSQPTFIISNKIHMSELVTAIRRQERHNARGC